MSKAQEIAMNMSTERAVITGLIVSQPFCARIVPMMNYEAFKLPWVAKIVVWAVDFYKQYQKPIYMNIQTKFESEYADLDPDEAELIQTFLTKIAKDYEQVKVYFNDVFYIDRAIDFFRKQILISTRDSLDSCIQTGRIDEGFASLSSVKELAKETTKVVGLYNPDEDDKWFDTQFQEGLIHIPGAYGQLIGPLQRGQLVAFLGPMKKGKTWFLMDMALNALMSGLKVLYISHEMTEDEMKKRFYSMILKRPWRKQDDQKHVLVPSFDCLKNQQNNCHSRMRKNAAPFGSDAYKPCAVCRKKAPDEWVPESCMIKKEIPEITRRTFAQKMRGFEFMYGKNFRMRCANLSSTWPVVRSTIDSLDSMEDFFADVVIEDYFNIRANYNFGMSGLNKIDMIDLNWKESKAYAANTGRIYITGHQGTRATISKKRLKADDTSGFIDIVAHVNKLFGLNQTTGEKKRGLMRINTLVNRHEEFFDEDFVTVLQSLGTGRVVADSHYGIISSAFKNNEDEK